MNREQRRKAKKDKSFPSTIKKAKAVNYVKPLSKFLDKLEKDEVLTDQFGNILIDMNDATIKDMVDRRLEPYHAILNLNIIVEIFQQVSILSLVKEDVDAINVLCEHFRRKILKRLEMNAPIDLKDVKKARELEAVMILTFTVSPVEIANKVKQNVLRLIYENNAKNNKWYIDDSLKSWMNV